MTLVEMPVLLVGSRLHFEARDCPTTIPISLLETHERQAIINHGNGLQTIASRGGLSPSEIIAVLEDRPWSAMLLPRAIEKLNQYAKSHQVSAGE